jgi:hypothetical protein
MPDHRADADHDVGLDEGAFVHKGLGENSAGTHE